MQAIEKNFIHLPSGRWCKIISLSFKDNEATVEFGDFTTEKSSFDSLQQEGKTLESMLRHEEATG